MREPYVLSKIVDDLGMTYRILKVILLISCARCETVNSNPENVNALWNSHWIILMSSHKDFQDMFHSISVQEWQFWLISIHSGEIKIDIP